MFHADGRADGKTDRQDKATSRFSQLCERAYKVHNLICMQDGSLSNTEYDVYGIFELREKGKSKQITSP